MMTEQMNVPFSTVLASTIHDMKNALSIIIHSADVLSTKLETIKGGESETALLRYEVSRVNGLLVQLLALYKAENNQLPLNVDYHNVYDFLEEQLLNQDDLLKTKNLHTTLSVDEDLIWPFDSGLMASVVANIITNDIRYTNTSINVQASVIDEQLEITISDDGKGYPESMISSQNEVILGINQSTGSTGLGIYFAAQVASMHQKGNLMGCIQLTNAENSGSIFKIKIP